ncbi:hypothetical protein B0J13DRAFT_652222, partial [Dactylonectria estremocensis]
MDAASSLTITCAENISLLFLLHSVPTPPVRTPIKRSQILEAGYSLPFDKERSLASTLAFLSSIRDDPNRIPAVCVQEDPDSEGLNIILAINRANGVDGQGDLQEVERGLREILIILSHILDGNNTESDVFNAVVSMCSTRILCRLRLRANSRNKPKQPINEVLHLAIASLKQLNLRSRKSRKMADVSTVFETRAKAVIQLVGAWTKHQTMTRLGNLIEGIHCLWQTEGLSGLLDSIPNTFMDPGSRTNLWNIVSKVARYREAARILYRAGKRFSSVRQAKVVPLSLPSDIFNRAPAHHWTRWPGLRR